MAGRIGSVVRLGSRWIHDGDTAPRYETDGGVGNARQSLAIDWQSDDGDPEELELTIVPKFQDWSIPASQRPGSMLPFRWGSVQSLGGVTIDEGAGFQPMAPITARGVRVQMVATTLQVGVGFVDFPVLVDGGRTGWVDLGVTIAPIFGGGSSLIQHTMQLPMIADRWPGGVLPLYWELPRFSREWRMRLDACDLPETVVFELVNPKLDVVATVALPDLAEWSLLDADAWAFRPNFSGGTYVGVYDGTLTVSFR